VLLCVHIIGDNTMDLAGSSSTPSTSSAPPQLATPMPSTADLPSHKQHRRVSLPNSPRHQQPPWVFRDDTDINKQNTISTHSLAPPAPRTASGSALADDDDHPSGPTKKTTRKKWSMEETDMLVQGCKKVCCVWVPFHSFANRRTARGGQLEANGRGPRARIR
jgi:hypothetical protein